MKRFIDCPSKEEIVEEIWNVCDIEKTRNVSWLSTPYFSIDGAKNFLKEDFSGDLIESLHEILLQRIGKQGENLRGLALVCGDMKGERMYFQSKILRFLEVDGMDISATSLGRAIENCKEFSFKFNPMNKDLNNGTCLANKNFSCALGLGL